MTCNKVLVTNLMQNIFIFYLKARIELFVCINLHRNIQATSAVQ